MHEDAMERGAGPELGDYGGFPINEAGRLFALSYDASRVTLRHHQCDGYVAPYSVRSIGNARAWEERDPHTQRLLAIHWYNQTFEGHRTIWMDGRPHPPAYAPHTWMGFSTGRFVGNALEVQTTHLKQGWLRRNGLPESDQATLVEFFVRHGDRLTHTSVITDPVYLAGPEIRTTDFFRQPVDHQSWLFACDDGEQILGTRARRRAELSVRGESLCQRVRPDLSVSCPPPRISAAPRRPSRISSPGISTLTDANALVKMRPSSGAPVTSRAVDPTPRDGEMHVWRIRDNVYLLAGDEGNIVVQVGDEGALVVDTGSGRLADKTLTEIRRLSDRPMQFIANTNYRPEHTGGNVKLRAAGADPSVRGSFFSLQFADAGVGATIIAHQNVQNRLVSLKQPAEGIPSDTYLEERRRMFHNNDTVEMFWEPQAVTDGDSIVHFRRADVIVAGRRVHDHAVSDDRRAKRRQRAGRDQGAQRHPQSNRVSARGRGRHRRGPRTWIRVRRTRGGRVSRHGGDRPRSCPGVAQEGRHARSSESRKAHRRLRHAIRRDHGSLDDRHVR